jgi:hypothetical protein
VVVVEGSKILVVEVRLQLRELAPAQLRELAPAQLRELAPVQLRELAPVQHFHRPVPNMERIRIELSPESIEGSNASYS